MVLQIGDFSREIKSFNMSSRKDNGEDFQIRLTIECISASEDLTYLTNSIVDALAENDIEITNGSAIYSFENYELDGIDKTISETSSRLSINFIQK